MKTVKTALFKTTEIYLKNTIAQISRVFLTCSGHDSQYLSTPHFKRQSLEHPQFRPGPSAEGVPGRGHVHLVAEVPDLEMGILGGPPVDRGRPQAGVETVFREEALVQHGGVVVEAVQLERQKANVK